VSHLPIASRQIASLPVPGRSHNLPFMTDEEALEEARRRWGLNASIERWKNAYATPLMPCLVGRRVAHVFEILGEGNTWEEAFERAGDRQ